MTLDKFFPCLVEDDYTGLIISGQPPEEALADAWRRVCSDYFDAVGDENYRYILELTREIDVSISKIESIEASIACLKLFYSQEHIDILLAEGFEITASEWRELQPELDEIQMSLGNDKIEIEIAISEMEQLNQSSGQGEHQDRPTYEALEKQLTAIEIGLGLRYPIDKATTYCRKYFTWINMLKERNKPKVDEPGIDQ